MSDDTLEFIEASEGGTGDGDICFAVRDHEAIIKLKANGDIYVKGKLIENDKELVQALREFLLIGKRTPL